MASHSHEHSEQVDAHRSVAAGFIRPGDPVRTTFLENPKIAGKPGFLDFCKFNNSAKEAPTREIF
jgi:hypothetical protein